MMKRKVRNGLLIQLKFRAAHGGGVLRLACAVVLLVCAGLCAPEVRAEIGDLLFVEAEFDGVGGVDGLNDARRLAISPAGRHVYVTSVGDDAVAVFARDSITGELSFVEAEFDGVAGVNGLSGAFGVAISPDGEHLYVVGGREDALAVFSRDTVTGELSFVEAHFDGAGGVDGLDGARGVAVSPDGVHVYVTGMDDDAVAVFSRNASSGKLTYESMVVDGAGGVDGLDGAVLLTVSPDGAHVYVTGYWDNAVAVFSRSATTGALTFVEAESDGVGGADGLQGPNEVAVSPDGKHVYVAGGSDDAIAVFSRNGTTGALTFEQVEFDDTGGVDGLDLAAGVSVSPDGQTVYVTGRGEGALAVFTRDSETGALTFDTVFLDGEDGVDGLDYPFGIAVTEDGRGVYVASSADNAVAAFSREAPEVPVSSLTALAVLCVGVLCLGVAWLRRASCSRPLSVLVVLALVAVVGMLLPCRDSLAQVAYSAPAALNTNAVPDSGRDWWPQVTTDGAGNWVAVWSSNENIGGIGTDYDILVSRSVNNGGTWTAPAALNTNAVPDSGLDFAPVVTTDGLGNWVAVWHSDENLGGTIGGDVDILISRSTNNGVTWSPPAALNTNAGPDSGDDTFAYLETDGAGNWVAVWTSYEDLGGAIGPDADILVSRSTDSGTSWTAPGVLNSNAGSELAIDENPRVTTDGAGNWVAVWESWDDLGGTIGGEPDILVSRSANNGATWTPAAALNTNAGTDTGGDGRPQVTTDGAGTWVAAWSSNSDLGGTIGTDMDILVSRSTNNGATWTAPAALNTYAGTDSGADWLSQVTTDGAGSWVAVWRSDEDFGNAIGSDTDLLVSRSTDNGATWATPRVLNTSAEGDTGFDDRASVATDGAGNWVVVWESDENLGGIGTDWDILVATGLPPVYVDTDAAGGGNGTTWGQAYQLIQDGITAAAVLGQEVWVADGTYLEAIEMVVTDGVAVYGGFNGTETFLPQRDVTVNVTTIDASTSGFGGNPAYHAVRIAISSFCRLDGFTVTGGVAVGGGSSDDEGGGIHCYFLDDTSAIANCIVRDNTAEGYGGGIGCEAASPTIVGCTIIGNDTTFGGSFGGGGVAATSGSSPSIVNCNISGNTTQGGGGGIFVNANSSATIASCTIGGNITNGGDGAGVAVTEFNSAASLTNCMISGNWAQGDGGGVAMQNSLSASITNCTISSNRTSTITGGGVLFNAATATIVNTIFEDNMGGAIWEGSADADATVTYCLFYDNENGDFVDENTTTYTGASTINYNVPEASNNMGGYPSFQMGRTGTWTSAPVYDAPTNRTTYTDSTASLTPGALVGTLINPDTSMRIQQVIVSNTATTIVVVGNLGYVSNGSPYQLIDYHLTTASPCIDRGTGTGAPATDFEGDPRPEDMPGIGANGTGTEYDVGADEYVRGSITVTDPDGGEAWQAGTAHNISWTSEGVSGYVRIYLYKGGAEVRLLTQTSALSSPWSWNIPGSEAPGDDYTIRIESVSDGTVWDTSDAAFAINGIRVTSPNGGEEWKAGDPYTITWESRGLSGDVRIYLYKGGVQVRHLIWTVELSAGSWEWDPIPFDEFSASDYKIRIVSIADNSVWDEGDEPFAVLDRYEPDDVELQATVMPIDGTPQTHGLHEPGDEDWTIFYANAGHTYTLTVQNVSPADAQTEMTLFDSDGTTKLAENVGSPPLPIVWTAPADGLHYVRVRLANPYLLKERGFSGVVYTDWIEVDNTATTTCLVKGYVHDPKGTDAYNRPLGPISGATVTIRPNPSDPTGGGDATIETDATGYYYFSNVKRAVYYFKASAPGFFESLEEPIDLKIPVTGPVCSVALVYIQLAPMEVTVTSPTGGGSFAPGTSVDISWDSNVDSGNVRICLYKGDERVEELAEVAFDDSPWPVTIPGDAVPGDNYKIRVELVSLEDIVWDESDQYFAIEGFKVTSPNGGEVLAAGTSQTITWTSGGFTDPDTLVRIYLYKGGTPVRYLKWQIWLSDGSWTWDIPSDETLGSDYKIKLVVIGTEPQLWDESDSTFTIKGIKVDSPDGGENWQAGTSQTISWTSAGFTDPETKVRIYLYKGGTPVRYLKWQIWLSDGSWTWDIPSGETPGSDYTIRIVVIGTSPQVWDESDSNFTIKGIKVDSPNGGEPWTAGTSQSITWTSAGFTDPETKVRIYLYKGGTPVRYLKWQIWLSDGSWTWDIPSGETPGTDYKIRLVVIGTSPQVWDESDSNFTITASGGKMEAPPGTDVYGDANKDGYANAVDVQLLINAVLNPESRPVRDADINGDGTVDALDVQLASNAVLGIDG